MKKGLRLIWLSGFLLWAIQIFGQVEDYEYRTPIIDAQSGWNSIILPSEMLSQAKDDLSDIRIYRNIPKSDKSIEQPYIIEIQESKNEKTDVQFKIINPTVKRGVYSYTFELSNQKSVNRIHLNFSNKNFDWLVHLEGSMDQNSWSTITHNYRIVSLKNSYTDFQYTDLSIPESKFNFYKISFSSSLKPNLKNATLSKEVKSKSSYTTYPIQGSKKEDSEDSKTTTIELDLGKKLPVSQIEMNCTSTNDYYRPIKIEGVVDSFETEKGWKYRYTLLYQGTLNSINENAFSFLNRLFQKFRITIKNFDNQPLSFNGYSAKGPNYRLITRLDDTENIILCYGNEKANSPLYDISYFKEKIPNDPHEASLGDAGHFPKGSTTTNPLFKNKWWLWGLLILVIILLGVFTLKMLKEEK